MILKAPSTPTPCLNLKFQIVVDKENIPTPVVLLRECNAVVLFCTATREIRQSVPQRPQACDILFSSERHFQIMLSFLCDLLWEASQNPDMESFCNGAAGLPCTVNPR